MKFGVFPIVIFLFSLMAGAQEASISGTVVDAGNAPLVDVNVMLVETTRGGQTDSDGNFMLNNIPTGDYVLRLSSLGFKTKEIAVTVPASSDSGAAKNPENENNTAAITNAAEVNLGRIMLYEGNEVLSEVVVQGERRNKFSRKQTAYVAKLPIKDIENTQVYSTVTTELLESQVVTNFDDALKNATGVENLWASTGRGGDGAGYYSLRGFSVQPQLVNGLPGLTNGTINPANIERIEVIKGPSATLFGNAVSSYGGLINVVTKK
ncbi:MAG: DUF2012 domain-containing protein, partial [Pricia sp.]